MKKIQLKPIAEQVIVITGATSGIGLATARLAAERGARLVLAARGAEALNQLAKEIADRGGEAEVVVADVGVEGDVHRITQVAESAFGGFDTWINNAGVTIYGTIEEVAVADMRRLFETNFWGTVYGSREAVAQLKERGGALINIGSTLSDVSLPLQGMYSASKHAIKGFTDTLRMELDKDNVPVSVTLVKPGPIDTPYTLHAKNYMDAEPKQVAPVYSPDLVAKTILHCAETPVRDIFVGSGGKLPAFFGYHAPRLTDRMMEAVFFSGSKSDQPPHKRHDNGLERSTGSLEERGNYPGLVRKASLYTAAELHPAGIGAALAGAGTAALAWRTLRRR